MSRIVSKGFSTINQGRLDSSGYWTVHSTITERVEYEDGTVKEEEISAKCMDMSFDLAHQTALASALIQYREETLDRGIGSLVTARERHGKLHDNSTGNSDTLTQ